MHRTKATTIALIAFLSGVSACGNSDGDGGASASGDKLDAAASTSGDKLDAAVTCQKLYAPGCDRLKACGITIEAPNGALGCIRDCAPLVAARSDQCAKGAPEGARYSRAAVEACVRLIATASCDVACADALRPGCEEFKSLVESDGSSGAVCTDACKP